MSMKKLTKVMVGLGYERHLLEEGDRLERLMEAVESGDRERLIGLIIGGATYAEAAEDADAILDAMGD